jgi:hypothetical protein
MVAVDTMAAVDTAELGIGVAQATVAESAMHAQEPGMRVGHVGMRVAALLAPTQAAVDTPWLAAVAAVASTAVAAASVVADTAAVVVVATGKI